MEKENSVVNEMCYRDLFNELLEGFALHEIVCDEEGRPINYRFIHVNPAFEKMVGLQNDNVKDKLVLDVLPNTEKFWIDTYGHVALTGEPIVFEHFAKEQGKYFQVTSFSPKKGIPTIVYEEYQNQANYAQVLYQHALQVIRALNAVFA